MWYLSVKFIHHTAVYLLAGATYAQTMSPLLMLMFMLMFGQIKNKYRKSNCLLLANVIDVETDWYCDTNWPENQFVLITQNCSQEYASSFGKVLFWIANEIVNGISNGVSYGIVDTDLKYFAHTEQTSAQSLLYFEIYNHEVTHNECTNPLRFRRAMNLHGNSSNCRGDMPRSL